MGASTGCLVGLRVAVKDNFDIAGMVTGGGNPEWAATHDAAEETAAVVSALLDQGADIVGKTHMDELAYSLMGQNARYGTPINPAAPLRMPGGSSSGSATAVAANLADIGLGSDTGGSVRLPASFCGLVGWRPTHGLLPPRGMLGLAPTFDVPGFFTRDLQTMGLLVTLFCGSDAKTELNVRVPSDIWNLVEQETKSALLPFIPSGDTSELLDEALHGTLLQTFRVCQGYEIAQLLGPWVQENKPAFGPGIRERFAAAFELTESDFMAAKLNRERICQALASALPAGTVLVYPTAPGPAPLLTVTQSELEQYRNAALTLLSIAGHAGLPQITLPVANIGGAPVGLSLVGARGSDVALLKFANTIIKNLT
ncbi:amidase [Agrobacterium rhizogenes]|nr:amidase [Rhizobium rhizogenes]